LIQLRAEFTICIWVLQYGNPFKLIINKFVQNQNRYFMKTIYFLTFLVLCTSNFLYAQSWVPVGPAAFSQGEAFVQQIAVDGETPYVAYMDRKYGDKATVMKFNGTDWVNVGPAGFTPDAMTEMSFAMIGSTPYVAFDHKSQRGKISVMKFDGAAWVFVGNEGFIEKGSSVGLAAGNGVLYLSFEDWENKSKASVLKFTGSKWEYVGNRGFSSGITYNKVEIAVDGNTPYVAYRDYDADYKASVMKFNGTSWDLLGVAGFSDKTHDPYQGFIVKNGTPYLASWDVNYNPMVYKFDGKAWGKLGVPFLTTDQVSSQSICFAKNGILYFVFADWGNGRKATVVKYDGTKWSVVGDVASKGGAETISIACSESNIPYIAYRDNYSMRRTTVMKLGNATNATNIEATQGLKVYPNPGKGLFTVEINDFQNDYVNIEVFNPIGQVIFSRQSQFSNKIEIDLSDFENGIYYFKVTNNKVVRSKSIMINR
jgi:hypothetical protein